MPLPTVISDISPVVGTGAAPNAGQPGGGENPSTFDDYLRLYAAFIAQLRAGGGLAASGANRVPFFDGTGALTSAADFVRDGSGNVGIGVSNPGARLEVNGNINTSEAARLGYRAQTDVATIAGVSTAAYGLTIGASFTGLPNPGTMVSGFGGILFATDAQERVRISKDGNVGIGITPSSWNSVWSAVDIGPYGSMASERTATSQLVLGWNVYGTGVSSYAYRRTGDVSRLFAMDSTGFYWSTAPSGTAGNAITFTERMRIDASGNVGIGTATPGARLDVNGTIRVSVGANSLQMTDPGDLTLNASNASGQLAARVGGAERLRIDSNGHQINTPGNTTPPTLTANGQLNLTPTSNTNLRISYRGTDGVTRVANITLA